MNAGTQVKIAVLAVLCATFGVVAFIFSTWFLILAITFCGFAIWAFIVQPGRVRRAEARLIDAQANELELKNKILLDTHKRMADFYVMQPDAIGNYPALFNPRAGKIAAYVPPGNAQVRQAGMAKTTIVESVEEVQEEELALPSPKKYNLSDALNSGIVTQDNEHLLGYDEDGQAVYGRLFDEEKNAFNSAYLMADQASGKSSAAALIAAYTVLSGGRVLVIDPDFMTEQSLSNRLGPIAREPFLLAPIGKDPKSAMRVLDVLQAEFDRPGSYPVCGIVDEATAIFAAADRDRDEWQEVGERLKAIAETYATRGRKRARRLLLLGQGAKVARTGGSDVRDSMTTLAFKFLKKRKAQLALNDKELAEMSLTLNPGQCIFIPDRSDIVADYFLLQLIYADEAGLQTIAQAAQQAIARQYNGNDMSDGEIAYHRRKTRASEVLRADPSATVEEIIRYIYGVSKGGSPAYEVARVEIGQILEEIQAPQAKRLAQ